MEITVRVVSCLLGTCFVIDFVPVKSEILINERKKMKKKFWHRKLSPGLFFTVTMMLTSLFATLVLLTHTAPLSPVMSAGGCQ